MGAIAPKTRYAMPRFIREPMDVYQGKRDQYFTSHQLIDYAHCPKLFQQKKSGLLGEVLREYYLFGAAAHCLILEGMDRFRADYIVGEPINPKTDRPYGEETKAYSEWRAKQHKPAISGDQYTLLLHMQHAVRNHKRASRLLADGAAEGVLREEYCGIQCQIRVDWFNPSAGLIDLKTCDDLDDFAADCERYHYPSQMAFYRSIIRRATGDLVPVRLIGIEKRPPYRCGVWRIAAARLREAHLHNAIAMRRLAVSLADDHWPTRYEAQRILN